jgi:hypothetical protein
VKLKLKKLYNKPMKHKIGSSKRLMWLINLSQPEETKTGKTQINKIKEILMKSRGSLGNTLKTSTQVNWKI